VGGCFQEKTSNISETAMLLLITSRKLHTRFPLVSKSTAFSDPDRP